MSGLNLVAIQETIAAHIRAEFPGYEVYEDFIIDDEEVKKTGNNVKPYIVLTWSSLGHSTRGASFAGVRYDEYYSSFEIGVVAPTPKQCRKSLNVILDRLIGWSPDGSDHLVPFGGGGMYVAAERNGKPHLYIATANLSFPINANNVGSYITQ
jgi:hypothetical protein